MYRGHFNGRIALADRMLVMEFFERRTFTAIGASPGITWGAQQ
jgi:hypothetical protein